MGRMVISTECWQDIDDIYINVYLYCSKWPGGMMGQDVRNSSPDLIHTRAVFRSQCCGLISVDRSRSASSHNAICTGGYCYCVPLQYK